MNLEYINRTTNAKNCCKSIDLSLTSSERQRDADVANDVMLKRLDDISSGKINASEVDMMLELTL